MDNVLHERNLAEADARVIETALNTEEALAAAFRGTSTLLLDILSELRAANARADNA